MSLSSHRGRGAASPGVPTTLPAEIVALEHAATADRAANVMVIRAAATLYVHPDTLVYRLRPTGDLTARHPTDSNDPIPLRRNERDGPGLAARVGIEAAIGPPVAKVRPNARGSPRNVAPNPPTDSGPLAALIVNQYPLERRGFAAILREDLGIADVCHADSAETALTLARERRPGLAVIDMQLPASIPARELCAQLRAVLSESRIILVTASDRVSEIRDCLMAGANGCLLKDTPERKLAESIHGVLTGKNVVDPKIAQKLAGALVRNAQGVGKPLTTREREVLDLLAEGCTNRKIADRLILSETTVKGHVSRLFEKISATSRLEVVVQARRVGLL